MHRPPLTCLLVALSICAVARAQAPDSPASEPDHPASIALWPNGAPGSEARKDEPEKVAWRQEPGIRFPVVFNIHNPSIIPFLPAEGRSTGSAVVIAPGGGHMFLTIDREGYDLAKWLAERGVAAFVLKYRLARDQAGGSTYKTDVEPVADAQRAMRLVRSRAAEWNIKPDRIGFLGFSAGGAPAWGLVTNPTDGKVDAVDPIERVSAKADFLAMIYAEMPRGDFQVSKEIPTTFAVVAFDDTPKIGQLTNLLIKLKAINVPMEFHVYASGGHGYGVRTDRPNPVTTWPLRLYEWLGDIGMLTK